MDRFPFWTRTTSEGAGTTGLLFSNPCCLWLKRWQALSICPMQKPQTWWGQDISLLLREIWNLGVLRENSPARLQKKKKQKLLFRWADIFSCQEKTKKRGKVIEQVDGRNRNRTDLSPSQLVPYSQQGLSSWSKVYPRNFGPIHAIFFLWLSFNNWDTRLTLVPLY